MQVSHRKNLGRARSPEVREKIRTTILRRKEQGLHVGRTTTGKYSPENMALRKQEPKV